MPVLLAAGLAEVQKGLRGEGINRIVLLGDGIPNDTTSLQTLAATAGSQHISITALGLGLDYNDDLMERLAVDGSGRYHYLRHGAELASILEHHGLIQIHRKHAVNPAHVVELRKREGKQDWEVKLAPPVNTVLPVARGYLDKLWQYFGER